MAEHAALDWIIRQRDPGFDEWDDFTAWLEEDPAHAAIYHELALAESGLDALVPAEPEQPVGTPHEGHSVRAFPQRRRMWLGGAIAACLVAALTSVLVIPRTDPWAVETAPGVRRTVTLADGSSIVLNGGTRLMLDHRNPRYAALERGEAMFTIRHDAAHPFQVDAGDARLVDIGTAFNVVRADHVLDVSVSEGAVLYNPKGEAARIDAGHALHADDQARSYSVSTIESADVASWRSGRLVYREARLDRVAADLARYYGLRVDVDPAIRAQSFRGVLSLPPVQDLAALAPVLGVGMQPSAGGWTLTPR